MPASPPNTAPDAPALLIVDDLEVGFALKRGVLQAVAGVSFAVGAGEAVGLVGESGCGKSVTAGALMGLVEPPGRVSGGSIRFAGEDLLRRDESHWRSLRGKRLAMVFQEPTDALNPVFTIGQQIDEQILRHEGVSRREARSRAIEMLGLVGLASPETRHGQYPHELSGGMRQRAMIAMALSCGPELLIADEPTTALDVTIQAQVLELLNNLRRRLGMAILFISHDLAVIGEIAETVVVMYAGRFCETGPTPAVLAGPLHPYTAGLMAAAPRLGRRVARLRAIPGAAPPLLEPAAGCAFAPRCERAQPDCRSRRPELTPAKGGRCVACFHPLAASEGEGKA